MPNAPQTRQLHVVINDVTRIIRAHAFPQTDHAAFEPAFARLAELVAEAVPLLPTVKNPDLRHEAAAFLIEVRDMVAAGAVTPWYRPLITVEHDIIDREFPLLSSEVEADRLANQTPPTVDDWPTVTQVAGRAGCKTWMVTRAANDGAIVTNGKSGAARRLEPASADRWVKARQATTPRPAKADPPPAGVARTLYICDGCATTGTGTGACQSCGDTRWKPLRRRN